MSNSYLIVKNGEITKWIVRTPILINEETLQKLFPDLPSDQTEREIYFKKNQNLIDKLFETVECWFNEGDPLGEYEDPKGKAIPNWKTADVELDNGTSYRYICDPVSVDLDLLKVMTETDDFEMPPDFAKHLKNLGPGWAEDKKLELYSPELVKKAEAGEAGAQFSLGVCYDEGVGVAQDSKEAVKWWTKSAEQGNAEAQNFLGVCYEQGIEVGKDDKEAVKWYRKSAEQGNAKAQDSLARCYQYGCGVTQDFKEAVKWWTKLAEQGNAGAQYSLGSCYAKGVGVIKDEKEAVKWYTKSAEQGFAQAKEALEEMKSK
jgi:hypothetical protein